VLSPDILEVDLDLIQPAELSFEAGQWVSVPFGPKNVRAYSIASSPRSSRRITLCADVAPGGIGSVWFRNLVVGQTVEFKALFGGFVVQRDDPQCQRFAPKKPVTAASLRGRYARSAENPRPGGEILPHLRG
jgi:ferredoxin-NADP reductase